LRTGPLDYVTEQVLLEQPCRHTQRQPARDVAAWQWVYGDARHRGPSAAACEAGFHTGVVASRVRLTCDNPLLRPHFVARSSTPRYATARQLTTPPFRAASPHRGRRTYASLLLASPRALLWLSSLRSAAAAAATDAAATAAAAAASRSTQAGSRPDASPARARPQC
jgi:hypothetical protein